MQRLRPALGFGLALLVALPAGVVAPNWLGAHDVPAPVGRFSSDAVRLPPGVSAHAAAPSQLVRLTFTLASRDPNGLRTFDERVIDPRSPEFHRFLTNGEVGARFGPPPSSISTVEQYLRTHGGEGLESTADGFGISVDLTAGGIRSILGTPLVEASLSSSSALYTTALPPALPPTLEGIVVGVSGLSGVVPRGLGSPAGRASFGQFVVDGSSGVDWYVGSDLVQSYGESRSFPPSGSPNATFASGQAVATILMSGFNSTAGQDLPPFDPSAVNRYFNDTFPPSWPHPSISGVGVTEDGVVPPAPGPLPTLRDETFNEVENSLDLEMAGSAAPGARVVNFYFGASLLESSAPSVDPAAAFATCLAQALAYNYSPARLVSVTNSFGLPDTNDSLWNTELARAAAMGVTVVAASGDQGNAPPDLSGRFQGQWPTWPGSASFEAWGDVAVGGTTVSIGGTPTGTYASGSLPVAYDSNLTGIAAETAWYDTLAGPGNYTGSEGGASEFYPEPVWQFRSAAQPAVANASVLQGIHQLDRSEPDLALVANQTLVYDRFSSGSASFTVVQGTSIASPLFAGMIAEAAAIAGRPLGFVTPDLYRIGSYFAAHPGPANPFRDVVDGGNYIFDAAPGWDAVTGWGGLNFSRFVAALTNSTVDGYQYTGPTPGLPQPRSNAPAAFSSVLLLAIGGALAIAAVVVVFFGRPGTRTFGRPRAQGGSSGSQAAPRLPSEGDVATFLCPYCGAQRPAEAVRCPTCGVF